MREIQQLALHTLCARHLCTRATHVHAHASSSVVPDVAVVDVSLRPVLAPADKNESDDVLLQLLFRGTRLLSSFLLVALLLLFVALEERHESVLEILIRCMVPGDAVPFGDKYGVI